MKYTDGRRTGLLRDLLISLASGVILAVGAQSLTAAFRPSITGTVPLWLSIAATLITGLLAFVAGRRSLRTEQAFIIISASTYTRWLADVLDNLTRSLDRHGIDLVVKLLAHDHSGRNQAIQMDSLVRKRRSYVGGFIITMQPERISREISDFCVAVGRPVIFLDVRPFRDPSEYPAHTAFVGCDTEEIGQTAAEWIAKELTDSGIHQPTVLVVTGDAQVGRHERFAARLRELLPDSKAKVNLLGLFSRERAREIVGQYLRQVHRREERLDAIFCTNDEMALGAVDALQEHGAEVGSRGPVIVGVDGIAEAISAIKSGTIRGTVVQDTRRIAEVAVDVLLRMRAGERVATEILVPTTVYPTP